MHNGRVRISRFPSLVDDVTVRLIAAGVLLVAGVALAAHQWWLYPVMAVEFALRAGLGPQASPLARLVQRLVRPRVAAAPRYTAGPPKRFAAAIGAVMTTAATILWLVASLTGSGAAGTAVVLIGAVMVVFPALEAVFGLCVGCVLFGALMRVGLVPDDICVECADITRRVRRPEPVA
jgi:Domain of unknown function (DUF4395)